MGLKDGLRKGLLPFVMGAALASSLTAPVHAAGKKFKIFLSMSYIGNDWQAEAENEIRAMAASQSLRDKVDLRIQVAGPNAQRQIQQINSMVQAGADAILVYPISPTALNAVVKNACERHVIVAAYDSVISEPCAYNFHIDQRLWGQNQARWLVGELHGHGIHIVAQANGMWSQAVARTELS